MPGANGRIAFATDRDGNSEIYTMEADGSDQRDVSANPANDSDPDISPDGKQIAFVSDRDGHNEIYVMAADGSGQTRVTNTLAGVQNSAPSWSPDGKQIVFQTNRFGNFDLALIDADGTHPRRLTTSPADDGAPSWSPNGDRIAFASNRDGDFEIFTMRATGGDVQRVTRNSVPDVDPTWSPDATTLTFDSFRNGGNQDIYSIAPDGKGLKRLTTDPASDLGASWSPDGKRIAFERDPGGDSDIYTMAPDGGSQTRVTTDPFSETTPSWGRLLATAPPASGTTAVTTVVKGTITIQLPGSKAFAELTDTAAIPIGAVLDTTKGTVRLTTSDANSGSQSSDFYDGVFKVSQKKGKAQTDLTLTGGSFKSCPKPKSHKASAAKSKSKTVRYLWGKGSGKFRTVGKYASATVRGTTWLTSDRCDGTLVKVSKGSVSVRDLRRHKTVVVRAHHSYLARKR